MKLVKFFFAFTFLLLFAVNVSAQDETSKVVWKNFHSEYKKLEYIAPIIVNESEQTITFLPSWLIKDHVMAELLVFDEENQKWSYAGSYLTCGLIKKVENQTVKKFSPNEEKSILLDFGQVFFSFSDRNFNSKSKFKILLKYQLKKYDKFFETISPEFSITEK
jgi:hypothetical protein